jgi:hypothetical protein
MTVVHCLCVTAARHEQNIGMRRVVEGEIGNHLLVEDQGERIRLLGDGVHEKTAVPNASHGPAMSMISTPS